MKNLFFVSVACIIFSGTTTTASAQLSFYGNSSHFSPEENVENFAIFTPISNSAIPQLSINAGSQSKDVTEMCTSIQFKYALLLNREVEKLRNKELYAFIDKWMGTRYRYGGSTKKGIDCSSLINQLVKEVYAIEISRTAREQYLETIKLTPGQLAEGDLVFFNTRGGVSHVGFYLGDGYFFHASSSSGVIISHLEDAYFKSRFIAGGRIMKKDYTHFLF